jgi:lipid-A-disaccharide synthase
LCVFPFEERFFRRNGVRAEYIGHPLARLVKPALSKEEFFRKHRLPEGRPLITLLPGSRLGEAARHLRPLLEAADRLNQARAATFALALPLGIPSQLRSTVLWERITGSAFHILEGETWDAIGHADLALAASGTVTIEAALLGTPMVTFYKVSTPSWLLGRLLVNVPFYSMVNLVAEREVVPELMQNEMTADKLAAEALRLLRDAGAREEMRRGLCQVAERLASETDPMERAAEIAEELMNHQGVSHDS